MGAIDLAGKFVGSYPADLQDGAGIRVDKTGLRARVSLDLSSAPALQNAPSAGFVPVQDPVTGAVSKLDFQNLPTSNPGQGTVNNVALAPAPALTFKGNQTGATAQPQDVPASAVTTLPTYTPAGTGAVVRSIKTDLDDLWVNVRRFGAKGDNTTDDLAPIQAAVDYLVANFNSGIVYFPRGRYRKTNVVSVPVGANILFVGDGMGASVLRTDSPTANGINFNGDETNFLSCGGGVQSMTIESGFGLVSSGHFGAGSSGTGISAIRQNDNWGLHNVCIANFANGLALLGCTNGQSSNLRIMFFADNGILWDKSPGGTTGAGHKIVGGKVSNFGYSGPNPANANGLRLRASGGEFLNTIDVTAAGTGVRIDPPAGSQVAFCWFHQVLADTSIGDGWRIDGSLGGQIVRLEVIGCWGSFGGANGLVTIGPGLNGLSMLGWGSRENGQTGWRHLGGAGIELIGADINRNSQQADRAFPGVQIEAGAGDFAIIGGRIGNRESGLANKQASAVKFAGASDDVCIAGVNMRDVGSTFAPIDYNRDLVTNLTLSGNRPKRTPGLNYSEAEMYSSAAFVGASQVVYVGSRGENANPGVFPWLTNKPQVIGRLLLRTATPVTGTYTATVYKNGAATPLTGALTTGQTSAVFFGTVLLDPLDFYEIRLEGAAGAAGAVLFAGVELEP